ncbi:hypothetical protein [Mesorhizobium sp. M8A.F.Ca.ET.165.01.1.1]|uniref:hypothetical protein n=1 Tax=Mesorhizobium sp. M8A.F.Ca.ET.165.01.1.1 TaxID=2563960 RepID=UPI0010941377|nr:hypothetical protein [Mesorhizobium sp. M8A.F.Ca.ET.165.01.1.1]TGT42779.1 hypothetical protein EN808_12925 [Mesorhizobium sp. M8A.F.Ca.ET.165.01.1.1]
MSNPRFGLYDGNIVAMFPRALTNTAVSPALLPAAQYARATENMLPNGLKAGSGAKRYGLGKKGNVITGANIVKLMEYRTGAGASQYLAYCDDGSIRSFNETSGAWTSLKTGLSSNGLPRWVSFNNKLVIVDGINTPMAYDGSTVTVLQEYVTDYDSSDASIGLATNPSQTSTSAFTIVPAAGRSDYAIGGTVRLTFASSGVVTASISNVTGTTTLTITVSGTPFPNPTETITQVEYLASPPPFSDIFVELDRLWALSRGETKAKTFRARDDAMKVFYTDATNNENAWFKAETQSIGYINLANKVKRFDELVRIKSIDGAMVFIARHNILIYQGTDPTTLGEFIWAKTLPVGCINGELVIEYPSDLLFFTQYGARSLQRVIQTDGLEVSADIGSNVDPTVTEYVADLLTSDATFRTARAFLYERDGFYGFYLGSNHNVMVYSLSEESKGWTEFSGLFKSAADFLGTSDGRLLIAIGGQLYAYANGTDTDAGLDYADDGVEILIRWHLPWLKGKGRWANVGYEILMDDVSQTDLTIYHTVDEDDSRRSAPIVVELTESSSFWDEAIWDADSWDSAAKRLIVRDKFLCDSFGLIVQNSSTVGPISILGIKPIGR